jgi:DNA-binding PadR family transcriptional regulator
MSLRQRTLDLAILGRLKVGPVHGYEMRKHLSVVLGPFRKLSYGSLYPALKSLAARGLITTDSGAIQPTSSGRNRTVYRITPTGLDFLDQNLRKDDVRDWDDDDFDVRFALFGSTDSATRLHILQGRRSRTAERLQQLQDSVSRDSQGMDVYTRELVQHGLDTVTRELRWLEQLIASETPNPTQPLVQKEN